MYVEQLTSTDNAPSNAGIKAIVDRFLELEKCSSILKQLHRFADPRQPRMIRNPVRVADPDFWRSSQVNPTFDRDITSEWRLRKLWIRALHLPAIYTDIGDKTSGKTKPFFSAIVEMHWMGMILLEKECLKVPGENAKGVLDNYRNEQANSPLSWVGEVRENVTKLMLSLTTLAMSKNLPTLSSKIPGFVSKPEVVAAKKAEEDALSDVQLITRNLGSDRVRGLIRKVCCPSLSITHY